MSWEIVAGLDAWSDCGVSPLRNKDRGFSRARCHSAVALYRALRATRAYYIRREAQRGWDERRVGEKIIREPDEIGPGDDLKETRCPPEKLCFVFSCARRRSSRSAAQLYTDIIRVCHIKLNARVIFELHLTHTDNN